MMQEPTTSSNQSFLGGVELRPLSIEDNRGLQPVGLALGQGHGALEVAITRCPHRPAQATMRTAWKARHGGRAIPLLLIALYADRAALCGPSGDEPPVYVDLDPSQVERICLTALEEPDRHAAARFLRSVVPEVESPLSGIRNEGLFATHELSYGVPTRRDWASAQQKARDLLSKRGRELLSGLGYQIEDTPGQFSVLRVGQKKVAVAIFLDRREACDITSERFGGVSPISYALAKADAENLDYVFVDHGARLRIYPTATGIGSGRRGRTETFVEIHLDLLPNDKAGYLWLLFSGEALSKGGAFEEILNSSSDYAADLGKRLRERIYNDVVPDLAMAIVQARQMDKPTVQDLATTYEMALTVLFRLLFIAYAEDKGLLPYQTNDLYKVRSLKQKARELAVLKRSGNIEFDESPTHWDEFIRLCRAINNGHREWGVPEYNGGLFSEEQDVSLVGAELARLTVPNREFGPILMNLLVEETLEGFGPVDFRTLGVREFGTIYEGLLESELSIAEVNLTTVVIDGRELYAPAENRTPVVRKSEVYLHNASGARKATGTYFTKHFAVEHLLDHALEPALAEHLERLDKMDDRRAGESFFDFRVADIAMGSGHFLVAAVDRIERRLSSYLARRKLPVVTSELQRLRTSAKEQLEKVGLISEAFDIEDNLLLRRQIARRCIYGVDINPVAVQLARLSLWIHTFVPGLPLSFLDHNIVCGNSLVGIATFEEVSDLLDLSEGGLFAATAQTLIGETEKAIRKLAKLSDANAAEIRRAREAYLEERRAIAPTERMFDILTAQRIPESEVGATAEAFRAGNELFLAGEHIKARDFLQAMPPFHFPVAFPEVFLRDRSGFDVIVGNPPWQEVQVEEHHFWYLHSPGIRSISEREKQERIQELRQSRPDLVAELERLQKEDGLLQRVLSTGPFPGMEIGDVDVYKAFCWRFWHLAANESGRIGVVLPRSALYSKGSSPFRLSILDDGEFEDVTFLQNNREWVFENVHPQYTIGLTTINRKRPAEAYLKMRGPFASQERFMNGLSRPPLEFPVENVLEWNETASLPLLPTEKSGEVFAQLRKQPSLGKKVSDSWRFRPYTELHATNDKYNRDGTPLMHFVERRPRGALPIFKGESFDIWEPDMGSNSYYAWGVPEVVDERLQRKRLRGLMLEKSAYFELQHDPAIQRIETLPRRFPRIAFRNVTRSTDTRTVRAALIPPNVYITNAAPTFIRVRGDEKDEAFLLGVLCSIPLDWYARRFVEINLNFFILEGFPIPRPSRDNPLWQRTVQLTGRLACPEERFAQWAETVGAECGPIREEDKEQMIFELDAVVAHLYGLNEAQLTHIFETFHEGWDYQARLDGVLRHYRRWKAADRKSCGCLRGGKNGRP